VALPLVKVKMVLGMEMCHIDEMSGEEIHSLKKESRGPREPGTCP